MARDKAILNTSTEKVVGLDLAVQGQSGDASEVQPRIFIQYGKGSISGRLGFQLRSLSFLT